MTRRDVVKLCIFTPLTALRENTQHYRFWGLKIFTTLTLRFQDFQRMQLPYSSEAGICSPFTGDCRHYLCGFFVRVTFAWDNCA
ncbi:MAG: hypothetical protein ABL884_07055 [Methyloglobulus sp.]